MGGIQSGKTTSGACKLYVDFAKYQDPDDTFIVAADTYKTLSQATIPKLLKFLRGFGHLNRQSGEFKSPSGATIFFRTGTEPESLEGITNVRRIWLDEGGKVSRYFFENIMGRAAFLKAPIDVTTTPYSLNWLADLRKQVKQGKRPDVTFVHCRSIDSPYFPKDEYDRQKSILDPKRFRMKYEGEFGAMEGLVFPHLNLCKSFQLPAGTRYYAGVDWGYRDPFCMVVRAVTEEGKQYRVMEYYKQGMTLPEIVGALKSFHALYKFVTMVCDPSQPASIEELTRNGLPAQGANNEIRLGLDIHYELIKQERFWIFDDMNPLGIDEYRTYHYREERELKIDEDPKSKNEIPVDQFNHGIDADRYLSLYINQFAAERRTPKTPEVNLERPKDPHARLDWLKKRRRGYEER